MEIIDLDALVVTKKVVRYKGRDHAVVDIPIEIFIDLQRRALSKDVTGESFMEWCIDYVRACVPTLSNEVKTMPFDVVSALLKAVGKKLTGDESAVPSQAPAIQPAGQETPLASSTSAL